MKQTVLAILFFCAIPLHAENINVAAASDLNFAIKDLIQQFEHDTGHKVRLSLGSSGNFYAQIINGAPFDVFLSADVGYARKLETAGKAVTGSTFVYGVGGIALWVPKSSNLKISTVGMKALLDPTVKKIAIANPDHAPYGRAAVAAMQKAGIYDLVKSKLVFGENISQAAQFAQSGAADIGIIALSIASSDAMVRSGTSWPVPREIYPPIEQGAVLLKHGGAEAKSFHEWLRSPEAKTILSKYGFGR